MDKKAFINGFLEKLAVTLQGQETPRPALNKGPVTLSPIVPSTDAVSQNFPAPHPQTNQIDQAILPQTPLSLPKNLQDNALWGVGLHPGHRRVAPLTISRSPQQKPVSNALPIFRASSQAIR